MQSRRLPIPEVETYASALKAKLFISRLTIEQSQQMGAAVDPRRYGSKNDLIHSVETTAANVYDLTPAADLLHGKETVVYTDAGYQGIEAPPSLLRPPRRSRGLRAGGLPAGEMPILWRVALGRDCGNGGLLPKRTCLPRPSPPHSEQRNPVW